jgi:diguanylate cyclase (GGDEF)-like protein
LAIVGLYGLVVFHSHWIAVDVARRETVNLAASLAQEASDTIEEVDGTLQGVVERVETDGLRRPARARLQSLMAQKIIAMPRLHGLRFIDQQGSLVVDNTSLDGEPNLNFRDREYFGYHRTHADRSAFISGPFRSTTENTWVIDISRRVDDPDGRFAGVAVGQISLDYIEGTYRGLDVGPSGVIDLVRENGTILVRKPFGREYVGHTIAPGQIFTGSLKYQSSGVAVSTSPLDGVRRLYAFQRLDRYPVLVIVALAERDYLASWQTDALLHLLATALIVAIIAWVERMLAKQIAQRKRAEERLERLAMLDGLTEIANRRQFDDTLERQWLQAKREETCLALLIIDADNFKQYNDNWGHQCGDEVLKVIAATIVENIRPSDLGARYGGEEFAVILPSTDRLAALKVAERIRTAVAAGTLSDPDLICGITISIGVACLESTHDGDRFALIATADAALYEAKCGGRNRSISVRHASSASKDDGVLDPDHAVA